MTLADTTYKLPEDGARVPKHVGTINIILITCAFVGVIANVIEKYASLNNQPDSFRYSTCFEQSFAHHKETYL